MPPEPTTPVTPAPVTPTTPTSTPATPTAPTGWTADFDPEDAALVTSKAWQGPGDAVKAYRAATKLLGGGKVEDLLRIPAETADPSEFEAVAARFGRPEKADQYALPEDVKVDDPGFLKFAQELMHGAAKHGAIIPARAFPAIVKGWNEYAAAQIAADNESHAQAQTQARASLEKRWGAEFGANLQIAQQFAAKAGLDEPTLATFERVLGPEKFADLFYTLGKGIGEHVIPQGGPGGASTNTPEGAAAKIKELRGDADFMKRYMAGEGKAKGEMLRLFEIANSATASDD